MPWFEVNVARTVHETFLVEADTREDVQIFWEDDVADKFEVSKAIDEDDVEYLKMSADMIYDIRKESFFDDL